MASDEIEHDGQVERFEAHFQLDSAFEYDCLIRQECLFDDIMRLKRLKTRVR